ncbi:MAG: aldo/keto reductase [Planctomycetota bacterium]|nr:aldo/keto reductase [Planctomycetota bacterium]
MEYRQFGKLNFKVSALGFGCMRLPTTGKPEDINEPAAIQMIRHAIDAGVNYIDTAYPYHGGNSEKLLAKALTDAYRQKVAIATKMPVWLVQQSQDFDRLFHEQLERLQTQHIDFYLLHNLQANSWAKMRQLNALAWLEKARDQGHISHIGFSFHDNFTVFKEIIDAYDGWEFCQIQYNYVNENVQAGTQGLQYAADKGLAVIIMEPLFGGALASPPPLVQQLWHNAPADPVTTALRWLWNKPQVATVLSGMSTLEQVQHNLAAATASGIGTISQAESDLITQAQEKYKQLNPIPCTQCGYCTPCPHGVAIPNNFSLYNNAHVFAGNTVTLSRALYGLLPPSHRAESCADCGDCEPKCPQQIPIRQWMPRVHKELSAK